MQLHLNGLWRIRKNGKPEPWQQLLECTAGNPEREAGFFLRELSYVVECRHEGFFKIRLVQVHKGSRIGQVYRDFHIVPHSVFCLPI